MIREWQKGKLATTTGGRETATSDVFRSEEKKTINEDEAEKHLDSEDEMSNEVAIIDEMEEFSQVIFNYDDDDDSVEEDYEDDCDVGCEHQAVETTTKFGLETIVEEVKLEQYEEKILEVYKRLGISCTPGASSVLDHQGSFGTKTTQEESLTVEFSPRCSTEGSEELSWRQIPPPSDDSARSSLSEARKIPAEEKEKSEEVLSEKSAESSARLSSKSKHCYKEEVVMQYLWQSTNLPPYSDSSSSVESQIQLNEKHSVELMRTTGATILFNHQDPVPSVPSTNTPINLISSISTPKTFPSWRQEEKVKSGLVRRKYSAKTKIIQATKSGHRKSTGRCTSASIVLRPRLFSSDDSDLEGKIIHPMCKLAATERFSRVVTSHVFFYSVIGFVITMGMLVWLMYEPPRPIDQILNNMPFVGRRRSTLQRFFDAVHSTLLGLLERL